mgnify:CR=1 FL=1
MCTPKYPVLEESQGNIRRVSTRAARLCSETWRLYQNWPEKKIKSAGQPKIDLKTYGEDKDLEYIISVTELPKVELKSVEKIKDLCRSL